jgi:putative transposase
MNSGSTLYRYLLGGPSAVRRLGYPTVVSWSAMRRSGAGVPSSGRPTPISCAAADPRPGDKWHLDEMFVKINGTLCYLWRAVDQHGTVVDVLVQSRRNAKAAKRFFRKLLKGLRYVPGVLVTDQLASYGVAHRELMASVEHRRSRYLNRAENSHQPTRQRERAMKRFKSVQHAQRFLSAFSGISAHFRPRRHRLSASGWRTEITERFAVWNQVTELDTAS